MEYKVRIFGKLCELPARTLAVDERIEAIGALDAEYQAGRLCRREVVEQMHCFVESAAPGVLPPVDAVDVNELTAVCTDIITAYTAPERKARNDAQTAELREMLSRPEVQKALAALRDIPKT